MSVSAADVKALRQKTGLGIMDCKRALSEVDGDVEKAVEYLRKKGAMKAAKRSGRETSEGTIGHYIHSNCKIGVLVELRCETDFAAKNDEFVELARNLAMHVAGSPVAPLSVDREGVCADLVAKERDIYEAEVADKPEQIRAKIVEGKLNKFYSDVVLMEQDYIKDDKKKIKDVLQDAIAKIGENITIARFARFRLGEA